MFLAMFVVSEADAAAIRTAFEQRGELSAAVELRRRFPGIFRYRPRKGMRPHHRELEAVATTSASADPGSRSLGRRAEFHWFLSGLRQADSGRVPKLRQLLAAVPRPRGVA